MSQQTLTAIIGGGPAGLATAAHLASQNFPAKLYEADPAVGADSDGVKVAS